MEAPKVSIIASSVRHHLWIEFMESLKENEIVPQVTFAGSLDHYQTRYYVNKYTNLQYVHTHVKPAQCYQVAFLYSDFDSLILWAADDCEFEPGLIDKVVKFYQDLNNPKAIISIRTNENGKNYGTGVHTLLGWNVNTPLMAPLALVSQRYIAELGGFDRRFISGQWENDFCMRAYADGGTVIPFEDGPTIVIEHDKKHGNSTKFWSAYNHDRKVLEDTWVLGGYKKTTPYVKVTMPDGTEIPMFKILDNRKVVSVAQQPFEMYDDATDILRENQGPCGVFEISSETKQRTPPAPDAKLPITEEAIK